MAWTLDIDRSLMLNCRFTSATISPAALPTDFMVRAANQYGIMQPMIRKASVTLRCEMVDSEAQRNTKHNADQTRCPSA